MVKKLLVIGLYIGLNFGVFGAPANQTQMKIHDYPSTTEAGPLDLLLLDYWNGTRFSTNKSISVTNFVTQIITNINQSVGKLSVSSNLSDVADVNLSRSNLVAETRYRYNVLDYGAVPGVDCSTIVQGIQDNIGVAGGEIFFPTAGTNWIVNLTITKPNVTIAGGGHVVDYTNSLRGKLTPANTALPVIQVGNDSGYVKGVVIKDLTLDGGSTGALGLYMAGGAFETTVRNVTIVFFTNCVKFLGGTTYPASLIYCSRLDIQPANVAGARGIYSVQTANYPTSWTTAIYLDDCHIQGPSSASNSYAMEIDSCALYLVNTYFDLRDGHGVKISKNLTQQPYLYCSNISFDSTPGTGAAIESFSNNRYFADQISGQFTVAGKWQTLDGTLLTAPQGVLRQNASLLYPQVQGSLNIVDLNNASFTGQNWTNQQIIISSDNFFINSVGTIKQQSALGAYQIQGDYSTGLSQFLMFDPVNSKTVSLIGSSGSLNVRAATGGGIRLQSSDGLVTGLQVNGTGGSVFLLGPSLSADTILYLDSNRQAKSATLGTGLGLSSGTLSINTNTVQQKVWVRAGTTNLGTFGNITFWPGNNTTLTTTNGTGNTNVDITISATASGSGTVGTMVSNGSTFVAGTVPISTDTTGTNFTGTATVTVTTTNVSFKGTVFVDNLVATNGITLGTGGTNLSVTGNVLANGGVFTNGVTVSDMTASTMVRTDTNKKLSDATAGTHYVAPGGSGAISGLSTGKIPQAASSTTLSDGPLTVASTTNVTLTGNILANGATFTNTVTLYGGTAISDTSTNTVTNKTYDTGGTGNVFKMTGYVDFIYPHRVDGTGATIVTNSITSATNSLVMYAGTGGTNVNYAWFRIGTVPYDLDTSVTMTLKGLGFVVSNTDTASASFSICYFSPASSSVFNPADFTSGAGYVNFTTGTLTSPAAGDQFYFSDVTLTGWASGLTAGRPFIIGIARDGGDSNNDTISLTGGTVAFGRTQ